LPPIAHVAARTHGGCRALAPVAAVLALLSAFPAAANDTPPQAASGLSVSGTVTYGATLRTSDRDPGLLPNVNSSVLGIQGEAAGPTAGRNQDDGDLNYGRGDVVSSVADAYVVLDGRWPNAGLEASAEGWYDAAQARSAVPWGNIPNGYAANSALSDAGAKPLSRFSGLVLENLYGYGHGSVDGVRIDGSVGFKPLSWGHAFAVPGGMRDLDPVDAPASVRAGGPATEGGRIPIPAVVAKASFPDGTTVETFYQLKFVPYAPNISGTFFSQYNFLSEGSDGVVLGPVSDRIALKEGSYLKRAPTRYPGGAVEGGIALGRRVDALRTKLSLYATQFDSRDAYASGIKTERVGAPFIPGDPGGLNPVYFAEYPEAIRMFGAGFETAIPGGSFYGEFTYRPNEPVEYNAADLLAPFVATGAAAASPLGSLFAATAPGGVFHGWQRLEADQAEVGANRRIPRGFFGRTLIVGAEADYAGMPDLPSQRGIRFGRGQVFGQGPLAGYPPPSSAVANSFDGFVSRNATAYRLKAAVVVPGIARNLELVPSVSYGEDLTGWSNNGSISKGRNVARLAVRANVGSSWYSEVAWVPTWGGTYNPMRDRSTAQASTGLRF